MTVQKRKRRAEDATQGAVSQAGMGAEIELLRDLLRRGLELASELEEGDREQEQELARLLRVLDSLSRTAARMGRMLVTQRELADDGLFGDAMREAMDRAVRRLSSLDGEGG